MLTKESSFKKGDNYDGMLLWQLVVEKTNLTTNVSIMNLKDESENVKIDDLGHAIKEFSTGFMDKRNAIIREVGKEGKQRVSDGDQLREERLDDGQAEGRLFLLQHHVLCIEDVQQPEVPWKIKNQECSSKETDQGGHKTSGPLNPDGGNCQVSWWNKSNKE
eukprot:10535053-Ditylum_brightwellii.AAC.1